MQYSHSVNSAGLVNAEISTKLGLHRVLVVYSEWALVYSEWAVVYSEWAVSGQ